MPGKGRTLLNVSIREARHFKSVEAKRHPFAELVERYLKEVLPERPRSAVNTWRHPGFWKQKLGVLALSDITPALLVQYRNELLTQPKPAQQAALQYHRGALPRVHSPRVHSRHERLEMGHGQPRQQNLQTTSSLWKETLPLR